MNLSNLTLSVTLSRSSVLALASRRARTVSAVAFEHASNNGVYPNCLNSWSAWNAQRRCVLECYVAQRELCSKIKLSVSHCHLISFVDIRSSSNKSSNNLQSYPFRCCHISSNNTTMCWLGPLMYTIMKHRVPILSVIRVESQNQVQPYKICWSYSALIGINEQQRNQHGKE